ncbi:MAG: penicillin-binding protein 2 [Phycisphaeraceae bacterium]|nr:penicillin-binding protein 2 [Phycisphaeraceae bacterium]
MARTPQKKTKKKKKKKTKDPAPKFRAATGLIMFLMLIFAGLGVRCYFIQYKNHQHYVRISLVQQRTLTAQQGPRGVIVDTRGNILAAANQTHVIFVDPQIVERPIETANLVADALGMDAAEIAKTIVNNRNKRYRVIKREASEAECEAVAGLEGIHIESQWKRYYPMGRLTSHVVGYVGHDGAGQAGLEFVYNRELAGESQDAYFLSDIKRRPISVLNQSETLPIKETYGQGMILTLDTTIQGFVRQALEKQWRAFEAESASAIVANPKTGAILAMVSMPDYDPSASKEDLTIQQNHAVQDWFEPGSVIKPIVVAMALDAGVIKKQEKIFCEDGRFRGSYKGKSIGLISEYNDHEYGDLTPKEILIHSSNIGMAKIGMRMGGDRLYKGLRLFGFGQRTGVNLPQESPGLLKNPEKADSPSYSVTRLPFGQGGICVSGVQLVRAFSVLVNQGRMIKPHVIQAFVDADGMPQRRHSGYEIASQVGYIIDPDIAKYIVEDALTAVINDPHGTGKKAAVKRWQVFGKTGTAEIARSDGRGGYEDDAFIASFIGGAPAEDPAVVVLVSIRRPNRKLNKGYTGGTVSGPVVGEIIERTLTYMDARGVPLIEKKQEIPERLKFLTEVASSTLTSQ